MRLILAIDPSGQASGIAAHLDGKTTLHTCKLTDIGDLPWTDWQAVATEVFYAIECPRNNYRGSNHVVKFAAKAFEAKIKEVFPRKNTNLAEGFIDPQTWRQVVLRGMYSTRKRGGTDFKAVAMQYCAMHGVTPDDHNQAEAFCILSHARVLTAILDSQKKQNANRKQLDNNSGTRTARKGRANDSVQTSAPNRVRTRKQRTDKSP